MQILPKMYAPTVWLRFYWPTKDFQHCVKNNIEHALFSRHVSYRRESFSLIYDIWSTDKAQLLIHTLSEILYVR